MYSVENPVVHQLAHNTPEQDEELRIRTLVIAGLRPPFLDAHLILHRDVAYRRVNAQSPLIPFYSRPLQAPYGLYQRLSEGRANVVAVHFKDNGKIEAYGPFDSEEEAYDYFPEHSTPHDTTVFVFTVVEDMAAR